MIRALLIAAAILAVAQPAEAKAKRCVGVLRWPCMHVKCLRHHSGACFPVNTFNATHLPLPDRKLTPGVARPDLTLKQICATKWGKDARAVSAAMKRQVFAAYGYPMGNRDPRCPCEVDHLVSRELGGADDVKNLWPQSYSGPWNARLKDRVENRLHVEMCAGRLSLRAAQDAIRADWTAAYRKYFGEPKP